MEGDSDDEGTDSNYEWPTAALDHGRAMQMAIEDREERQRFVAEWVTTVTTETSLFAEDKVYRKYIIMTL